MNVTRDAGAGGPLVRAFAPGGFRLDEATVHAALLMTVERAIAWSPPPFDRLDAAALTPLFAPPPEFILLGTGPSLVRPPRALVAALDARGLGIEPMDSRAAARAWGVLRGEGRRVAAALYPLG